MWIASVIAMGFSATAALWTPELARSTWGAGFCSAACVAIEYSDGYYRKDTKEKCRCYDEYDLEDLKLKRSTKSQPKSTYTKNYGDPREYYGDDP